jgi:predicted CXXCH cytochrome family protein
MKTSFAKVAGGLALLAVSSVAMASVVNTKHNLGASNSVSSNHTTATTEICIFCHTPHGGDQTTFAPIWNRAANTNSTYTRFSALGRLTFDAQEAPIGAVSAACLSCHDGTQSMDSVINSSGSDSLGMADTNAGNGFWSQGRRMGNGSFAEANGSWDGTVVPRGDMVFLGTDLSNDHPISMQYGGGGINSGAINGSTTDPDFAQAVGANVAVGGVAPATGNPGGLILISGGAVSNAGPGDTTGAVNGSGTGVIAHATTLGGADLWYVDTGTAGYQATDFPLYSRTDVNGSATTEPTVECGTCHDPHSGNPTFLRLANGNQGSQVCLTCHAK